MTTAQANPRVLLVDQSQVRAEALLAMLMQNGYPEVTLSNPHEDLLEQVLSLQPDVVLVEIDSPQRDILEQLATLRDQRPTPVAVFCQDAGAQSIRDAVESGVCAYVVEGFHPEQVRPAIGLAMSLFGTFTKLRDEAASAREQLAERKKIDRAKRLLMASQNLSEEQAFQTVRKFAMDRHRKLGEAADDLIAAMRVLG